MLACRLHIWMTVLSTSRSLPSCSVRAVAGAAGVTNKLGDLNHYYHKNGISGLCLCGHLLMAAVLTVSLVLLMFQLDMEGDRKCEAW